MQTKSAAKKTPPCTPACLSRHTGHISMSYEQYIGMKNGHMGHTTLLVVTSVISVLVKQVMSRMIWTIQLIWAVINPYDHLPHVIKQL